MHWPRFNLQNFANRLRIVWVTSQPPNSFGGVSNYTAITDYFSRLRVNSTIFGKGIRQDLKGSYLSGARLLCKLSRFQNIRLLYLAYFRRCTPYGPRVISCASSNSVSISNSSEACSLASCKRSSTAIGSNSICANIAAADALKLFDCSSS